MTLRPRLIPLLVATLAVIAVGEGTAAARKAAAVLGFSGPRSSRVRQSFIRALRKRAKVISAQAFGDAARSLGVDGNSAAGRAAVCAELRCHAVVTGRVARRGRRFTVTVSIFGGATGRLIGRRSARARGARRLTRVGANLGRSSWALVRRGRLGSAPAAAAPPAQPEPATPPPTPQTEETGFSSASTGQSPAAQPPEGEVRREEGERELDDLFAEDEDLAPERPRRKMTAEIFNVSAALGMARRSYELAGANATQNSTYKPGFFAEFTLRGEIYPAAAFTKSFFSHLGIGVAYTRHLSISTKLEGGTDDVSTKSEEMLLDALVRWPIFDSLTTPVILGSVGWGFRDFDLATNAVLPSFNYQFIRFGAGGILPLWTQLVAFEAGFDLRPLLKIGQEAINAYGEKEGGFAWSVRAGLSGRLDLGLIYFATFEYLSFSTDFTGLDPGTSIREGYPDRREATSGSDAFIRIWAGVGYAM
jgi:hypothetical protein